MYIWLTENNCLATAAANAFSVGHWEDNKIIMWQSTPVLTYNQYNLSCSSKTEMRWVHLKQVMKILQSSIVIANVTSDSDWGQSCGSDLCTDHNSFWNPDFQTNFPKQTRKNSKPNADVHSSTAGLTVGCRGKRGLKKQDLNSTCHFWLNQENTSIVFQ